MFKTHTQINKLLAFLVFLITFGTYFYFLAPSISFWDCGEYVAAGSSLGVPHPPGNPLYIMIARVANFSFVFFQDPAFRINVLTPLFAAFAMMFVYLTIIRILIQILGEPDTLWKKFSIYTGGIVGSLFAAFANTVAFSTVEAEVNTPLLLPIMLNVWLAVKWSQSTDPRRDRLLLLIAYISFLGIGIHMYSMIAMVPVFLFVVLTDKEKLKDWRLWIVSIGMSLVMYDVSSFIYAGVGSLVISSIFSLYPGKNQRKWKFVFSLSALAILGFTCHLYIPIRSNLNPSIDENHPATYQAFKDYLDRKQYGSESMITRMLWRRGSFTNQFGVEGHMGFGGFLLTQFFRFSLDDTSVPYFKHGFGEGMKRLLVYMIPVIFMLYGWFFVYRRSRNHGILLIFLTLATTVLLVFYMNFADGTRPERMDYESWVNSGKQGELQPVHREVRVRDYFFIAGFVFYGMWMGIAAAALLSTLYTNKKEFYRSTIAPIATILFLVSPALPMSQNLSINSRRGDYVPYDYAYNLLMSCDPNGVLFTNGDNDTFPLWAIQEAFGFRKDVRIVNLSLLNTDWYIKQLKNFEPKVHISYTDEQISRLNHEYNPFEKPFEYKMEKAGITVMLPSQEQSRVLRVQDKMVVHIIDENAWRKPIYMANTVSDDNFMGIGPFLSMEGLVFRVQRTHVPRDSQFNIERTEELIDSVYKFRSLNTWRAQNDETTRNLVQNYSTLFLSIGMDAQQRARALKVSIDSLVGDTTKGKISAEAMSLVQSKQQQLDAIVNNGVKRVEQGMTFIPWDTRGYALIYELLSSVGRTSEAEAKINLAIKQNPNDLELLKIQAQGFLEKGKHVEAIAALKKITKLDPKPELAYYMISQSYQALKKFDSAKIALMELKKLIPNDPSIDQLFQQNEALQGGAK